MPDIVDPATRSRMMSGIRGRDTKPERLVRKALHARGFRYRLNVGSLPGRPDMVFPKYRATVFVHGCFWHGHDCALFRAPDTRAGKWAAKISRNRARDGEVREALHEAGWRQLVIWECSIRGRNRLGLETVVDQATDWLLSRNRFLEIRGNRDGHD